MGTRLSEYSTAVTPPNGRRVRQLPQSVVPMAPARQALTRTAKVNGVSISEDIEASAGSSLGGLGELVQVVT